MAKSRRAKPKSHSNPEASAEPLPLSVAEAGAIQYFETANLPTGSFVVAPGMKIVDAAGFVKWNLGTVKKAPGSWLAKLAIDHLRLLKTFLENNK